MFQLVLLLALAQQGASDAGDRAAALELFRTSCSTCHLPPDPDFATDRAWLAQVAETA